MFFAAANHQAVQEFVFKMKSSLLCIVAEQCALTDDV